MLTKNQIKLILSLAEKKHRTALGLFVAEGEKACRDIMGSNLRLNQVYASAGWINQNHANLPKDTAVTTVTPEELRKISRHQSPQEVLMLVHIPVYELQAQDLKGRLTLLLETIQDPGNLGTILRIADWYGIEHVICSPDTTDVWNPKTIDSSMGSAARVKVIYANLETLIESHAGIPVYGAMPDAPSIYNMQLPAEAFLLIGNEGKGISARLDDLLTQRVSIPRFGLAESLNAAVATAIICDHFARQSGTRS